VQPYGKYTPLPGEYNHLDPAPAEAQTEYDPHEDYAAVWAEDEDAMWAAQGGPPGGSLLTQKRRPAPTRAEADRRKRRKTGGRPASGDTKPLKEGWFRSSVIADAATVLAYAHALSLTYAVDLLVRMGVLKSAAYAAFETLVRAGLAEKRTARDLACARARGFQQVIMLTPQYLEQAPALGLPPVRAAGAMVSSASPTSRIVEQVALCAELLRLLATGWTVAHDAAGLQELALARLPHRRGWGGLYGGDKGGLAPVLRSGQHVTLVAPPGGATWQPGAAPVLLLGGAWTPAAGCTEGLWIQLRECAPLDVRAWPRSKEYRKRVRQVLVRHCTVSRAPIEPELLWIAKRRDARWHAHWQAVHELVRPGSRADARPCAWAGMKTLWDVMYNMLRS
jgi:hypothetical protein